MKAERVKRNRLWAMAALAVVLFVALAAMPVAAVEWTDGGHNNNTYIPVANPNVRFPSWNSTHYYFNLTNVTGGMNAIHISANNYSFQGGVYTSNDPIDTFYVSDTGGRGCQDDILLLVAVNSTDPDSFAITINASGYRWSPTDDGYLPAWDPAFKTNNFAYWNDSFDSTKFR